MKDHLGICLLVAPWIFIFIYGTYILCMLKTKAFHSDIRIRTLTACSRNFQNPFMKG
jgi:hypothetical protein